MKLRRLMLRFLVLAAACITAARCQQTLGVHNLRCEYKTDPLGIDVKSPRLSWELTSSDGGVLQTSYEIRVTVAALGSAREPVVWETGKVASDASNQIPYAGTPLQTGKTYHWQVRVTDNHNHVSDWSEVAKWEMGLLNSTDWKAQWITPNLSERENESNPSPMLRREFVARKKIASARIYVSAMGLYELHLNGERVGDQYFVPGWTSYDFRYQYQTYDVTKLLKAGPNCLGAILGDGWYRGVLLWKPKRNNYGSKLALLAQLVIIYQDGSQEVVLSDSQWKASTGPILASDIYNGEIYDARLEKKGWSAPGYDDKGWQSVSRVEVKDKKLVAPAGPPVQAIEEIRPVKVLKTPAGNAILDMGQNMVGWVRFRLTAPAGTTVTLRHAEVLDKDGEFYTANLRGARQTIRYTAKGSGPEEFAPHFTFQGFRYVAVSGWPGEVRPEDFTGVVVHSAMRPTGSFESSDPLINQLEHNIRWGQKGNFLDVPTDCPQRDERLGWTGDAQVFAPTASFNFDTAGFYTKWLKDVALDQEDDGGVPFVVPNVQSHETRKGEADSAGWADVAVALPWTVYQAFGDKRILEEQYQSMKAWVDYMRRQAGESYLWRSGFSFGDWLAFATTHSDYPGATTDKDFIQTAYFAHSTMLLANAAAVIGKNDEAVEYNQLAEKIKTAFQREFVTPGGRLSPNTQTAYAMALEFDLLPESMKSDAAARLAADVRKFGHLTTGFLGTPLLCRALSDHGYLDEAYLLLNRKEYPSWLYPVTRGATTIWERWDGIKPDGSFQDPGMNSFNHYAYGAIGEWMYGVVAGIGIDEQRPGYKHILIAPRPGGGLTSAKASIDSIYGKISAGWAIVGGEFKLSVEIPPNTTATVGIRGARIRDLTENGAPVVVGGGIEAAKDKDGIAVLEIGSGRYVFESPYAK